MHCLDNEVGNRAHGFYNQNVKRLVLWYEGLHCINFAKRANVCILKSNLARFWKFWPLTQKLPLVYHCPYSIVMDLEDAVQLVLRVICNCHYCKLYNHKGTVLVFVVSVEVNRCMLLLKRVVLDIHCIPACF